MPLFLKPDVVNLWYLKFDLTEFSLKYLKYSKLGSKDIEIRILEFAANSQFIYDRDHLQVTHPFF